MKAQIGHAYMNTLSAARRHKHVNKQMRLVKELKAELLEMKTLLEALRAPPGPRGKRQRGCELRGDRSLWPTRLD